MFIKKEGGVISLIEGIYKRLTYKVGEMTRAKKYYNKPLNKLPVPSTGRDRDKQKTKRKKRSK